MTSRSLRSRLFRAIGLVVLLCVALTIGLGLVLTLRAVDDATLSDVEHQAALIASREQASVSAYTDLVQVEPLMARQHESYSLDDSFLPTDVRAKLQAGTAAGGTVSWQGTRYYYAAEPPVQGKTFVLLRPTSITRSRWTPYVVGLLIAAAAGGLLAAFAAFLLARRISRPVGRVADAARSLARGRYPEPVPVEGAAEIATLAVAFNALADQLRRAQEAERNFLLSVSHELKTPL
ncbi:MAG: HAMP domain-containing protein, partial [Gaiellaceae bacterium]